MRANPCAMLVESVSSPIILLMTPLLPLSIPQIQRLFGSLYRNTQPSTQIRLTDLTTRVQKEVERPKQSIERPTPNKPIIRTGLRPMRSERRLHFNTVSDSEMKKSDSWYHQSHITLCVRSNNMTYYNSSVITDCCIVTTSDI